MLPDLRSFKRDLQTYHLELIAVLARKDGMLGVIRRHIIHEGDGTKMVRADGSEEDNETDCVSAEMVIDLDAVPGMTADERYGHIAKMAEDMASSMTRTMYERLGENLDRAGQSISAQGRGFSPELLLEMFEKMEMDFDEHGNVKNIYMTAAPSQSAQITAALKRLETEPELRAKHDALMERKRGNWRDREASRKLVG